MAVRDGDGLGVVFHGQYREIFPNERIVSTEVYEGMPEGEAHDPVDSGAAREQGAPLRPRSVRDGGGMQEGTDLLEQDAVSLH